jgi:hypothetical protein
MQFVFAMPKIQRERIPQRPKYLSDESHTAQTNQRVRIPKNDLPAAQGRSPEKMIADSSRPQPESAAEPPRRPEPIPMHWRFPSRRRPRLPGTSLRRTRRSIPVRPAS